jgi:hypothetical protein
MKHLFHSEIPEPNRIKQLLDSYSLRFRDDFLATQPVPDRPTS